MDKKLLLFIIAGLAVSLTLAMVVSPWACSAPDGLEKVAEDKGFLDRAAAEPVWKASLMPDYNLPKVQNEAIGTAWAGFVGTGLVFVTALVLAKVIVRGRKGSLR